MGTPHLIEEVLAHQVATGESHHWFALADAAQSASLPEAVDTIGLSASLFDVGESPGLSRTAPYLVALPPFSARQAAWKWIFRNGPRLPCVSVLAAMDGFDAVLRDMRAMSEIRLPDRKEMFFAFWDPAILGTLVGQPDDSTLHVAGPVLTPGQIAKLLRGLKGWWYWDRSGYQHSIEVPIHAFLDVHVPFKLTQTQVNDLVEASVPDYVKYHIELNQRQLFDGMTDVQRHVFSRQSIGAAREIGLEGMGDLVNYTCASLIYRDRMHTDPMIATVLQQVKRKVIDFDTAMKEFP